MFVKRAYTKSEKGEKRMIVKKIKGWISTEVINHISTEVLEAALWNRMGWKEVESYSYYASTQCFANECLHLDFSGKIHLLSMAGKVEHIVPMIPMCEELVHISMMPMDDEYELNGLITKPIKTYYEDFFALETDELLKRVNCMISHAAIHCMNDTRYGNDPTGREFKSYLFAQRLVVICPNIEMAIVSVPVNENDCIKDNSSYLSNNKFIDSFEKAGFKLVKTLYDKNCLKGNLYEKGERFSDAFPADYCTNHRYVVGNYCFKRIVAQ